MVEEKNTRHGTHGMPMFFMLCCQARKQYKMMRARRGWRRGWRNDLERRRKAYERERRKRERT